MAEGERDEEGLLGARVSVPEHVVYREFPDETVILNLESGKYHGLNATAARILEVLDSGVVVRDAIDTLAREYDQPRDLIQQDVLALCQALDERGLIARDAGGHPT
jgi:Coenzyme PQQ synthesis protein D (PqqD)